MDSLPSRSVSDWRAERHALALSSTIKSQKPWQNEVGYFKSVYIQNGALGKIVSDACAGKDYEVMGLLYGHVIPNGFVISDSFCLPVEGTETRVNASEDADIFQIQYASCFEREDEIVGWYHSHPGYRPWLSAIDISTQRNQQAICDPFVALVVDPLTTVKTGKVDIGAFRVYDDTPGTTPEGDAFRMEQSLLANLGDVEVGDERKGNDFGAHRTEYYSLDVKGIQQLMSQQTSCSALSFDPAKDLCDLDMKEKSEYTKEMIDRLLSYRKRHNAARNLCQHIAQNKNADPERMIMMSKVFLNQK